MGFMFYLPFAWVRKSIPLLLIVAGSVVGVIVPVLALQNNLAPRALVNVLLALAPIVFGAIIFCWQLRNRSHPSVRTTPTRQLGDG